MMKTKTIRPGRIFSGIVLVFWTIVSIFPLYWMFIFSLKNNDEIYSGNSLALPQNWVLSNYTDALSKGHMHGIFSQYSGNRRHDSSHHRHRPDSFLRCIQAPV